MEWSNVTKVAMALCCVEVDTPIMHGNVFILKAWCTGFNMIQSQQHNCHIFLWIQIEMINSHSREKNIIEKVGSDWLSTNQRLWSKQVRYSNISNNYVMEMTIRITQSKKS